jgi:nitrogen fixation NifU-like protein
MADLRTLYQELLLDHGRRPRNFWLPDPSNRTAEGFNPLCGDRISLGVLIEDDVVREIGFCGAGCAISTAAASMMTEAVKGKSRAEVDAMTEDFRRLVSGNTVDGRALGKLAVFAGVAAFPVRVKCATLPWHTLRAALDGAGAEVSTE